MKIKTKKIIIYTFCLGLILCTVILSVAAAVSSYSYDINNCRFVNDVLQKSENFAEG